ncbi:MAG: hypothetical protein ABIG64_09540 [Candidatus Omnitrophota bacterium]
MQLFEMLKNQVEKGYPISLILLQHLIYIKEDSYKQLNDNDKGIPKEYVVSLLSGLGVPLSKIYIAIGELSLLGFLTIIGKYNDILGYALTIQAKNEVNQRQPDIELPK